MNQLETCLICGKPGIHWDVALKGFTCQFGPDGKKTIVFNEHGNEEVL
jgi:hypothetical protein